MAGVVHNGQLAWSVRLSLLECIDADGELLELQRDFGYQVRHLRPDESDASYSQDPVVWAVFRALAWAFVEDLGPEDLPPGHPLERPLLVYIARVYGSIEEADVLQAVEQTRPEQAEELVMTVAEQWVQRGRQEGRQAGRQEGEVELLLWQIRERFGSEAAERYRQQVEQADEAMIRTWSVRLLRAEAVEDVFADR